MRGRDEFKKYIVIIRLMTVFMRKSPLWFRSWLWRFTESWRGNCGVLCRFLIAKVSASSCGDVVLIGPYVEIRNWSNLELGSHVSIQRGCYLDAMGGLVIGDDVSIAHNCSILSFDHKWSDSSLPIRENSLILKPVSIENDVWIGCGVRILAGVTVSTCSVVAAGSVVTKDVVSNAVVGGVPARVLRYIGER